MQREWRERLGRQVSDKLTEGSHQRERERERERERGREDREESEGVVDNRGSREERSRG